jgi:NADH-quinone oxidoreductase subunit M
VIYDRTHQRGLGDFGGLAAVMPKYAAVFGLAFMASLGLPGLSGFVGEALVFLGAFPVHRGLTLTAALALVIGAAYHLNAIQKIHFGRFNEAWRDVLPGNDLSPRELATLVPLALIVLVLGFWPMPLINLVGGGVAGLVALLDAARAATP